MCYAVCLYTVVIYTNTEKRMRENNAILIKAKYRQSWYQYVQTCIGYTMFYF